MLDGPCSPGGRAVAAASGSLYRTKSKRARVGHGPPEAPRFNGVRGSLAAAAAAARAATVAAARVTAAAAVAAVAAARAAARAALTRRAARARLAAVARRGGLGRGTERERRRGEHQRADNRKQRGHEILPGIRFEHTVKRRTNDELRAGVATAADPRREDCARSSERSAARAACAHPEAPPSRARPTSRQAAARDQSDTPRPARARGSAHQAKAGAPCARARDSARGRSGTSGTMRARASPGGPGFRARLCRSTRPSVSRSPARSTCTPPAPARRTPRARAKRASPRGPARPASARK